MAERRGLHVAAHDSAGQVEGGIVQSDAWNKGKNMSTSSEERRRTEAALVRAIDMDPDVSAAATRSAICAYVDLLAGDGLLPEAVVIAFKSALGRAASLHRVDVDSREHARAALVSACIERYFAGPVADVRITHVPPLRLVREDREPARPAPSPEA
jgi:hypothetical protein